MCQKARLNTPRMSKYPNQNLSLANSSLSSPPGCSPHPQMSGGPSNTPIASSSLSRASSTGSLYAQVSMSYH